MTPLKHSENLLTLEQFRVSIKLVTKYEQSLNDLKGIGNRYPVRGEQTCNNLQITMTLFRPRSSSFSFNSRFQFWISCDVLFELGIGIIVCDTTMATFDLSRGRTRTMFYVPLHVLGHSFLIIE